jgi:hypothetical protein
LTEYTKTIVPTSFIPPSDGRIAAFILNAQAVIGDSNTKALTRSRLYLLLYNLCSWNIQLRRASSTSNMCAAIFHGLQHSVEDQLGPQNLIDVLRLLQLLTYERGFVVGNWTYDLIKYLNDEM